MEQFALNDKPFIELNNLLKVLNLVMSGGEAKHLIREGEVRVNKQIELRVRKKLCSGDIVEFMNCTIKIV